MNHAANAHLPLRDQEALWCADAIAVQDACNFGGVVHSLGAMTDAMHRAGLSTTAIADHPATQLYTAKLADLVGLQYWWPADAAQKAAAMASQNTPTPTPA